MIELLIKVGDGEGSWLDGMPIAAKPQGQWITYAEVLAWYNGEAPTLTCHNADEIFNAVSAAIAQGDQSLLTAAQMYGGFDTNWGHKDLSTHTVLIVDGTFEEIQDAMRPKTAVVDGKMIQTHKRRGTINYQSALSEGSLSEVEDVDTLVIPARDATPISFADTWQQLS